MRTISNRLFRWPILVVMFSLLGGCASSSQVSQCVDFNEKRNTLSPLCLIAPDVEILVGSSLDQAVRQQEDEGKISKDLAVIIASELEKREFEVVILQASAGGNASAISEEASTFVSSEPALVTASGEMRAKAPDSKIDCCTSNSKITSTLKIFKRPAEDNLKESLVKVSVALMTAGLVPQYKDPSGWAELSMAITEPESDEVLWSNKIFDYSHRMAGEVKFNLEELVKKLLEPLS